MKRFSTMVPQLLLVGVLSGCVHTESSSVANPDFAGRQFAKVAVMAATTNIAARKQLEQNFVATLQREGKLTARSSLEIWPLDASAAEMTARLTQGAFDALLILTIDDSGYQMVEIAGPSATATTYGNTTHVTSSPSTTVAKPHAQFTARLFDVATERVVWVDQAHSRGGGYTNQGDLRDSFVEKVVEDLIQGHLIAKSTVPPPPARSMTSH